MELRLGGKTESGQSSVSLVVPETAGRQQAKCTATNTVGTETKTSSVIVKSESFFASTAELESRDVVR